MGMGMCAGMGHAAAALAIMALVASAALLVWLGGKDGAPNQRLGKAIAWLSIILSALIIIGSMIMCAKACKGGLCQRTGGQGMMGSPMMRGMYHGSGMGMPQMPPPPAQEPAEGGEKK